MTSASSSAQLIFLDLDGTLIGKDQTVPESARQACEQAVEGGHTLFMCTGRSIPEIYPYLWDFGFSGCVAGAGSYVRVGQEVLLDERIDPALIEPITDVWRQLDGMWIWQGSDAMHPSEGFMEIFLETAGMKPQDWAPYAESVAPYLGEGLPKSSAKCTAYVPAGKTTYEQVRSLIPDSMDVTPGSVPAGNTLVFEVTPKGISKGSGIQLAARHLGFDIANTIAIGDSMNDLEALKVAGRSVAMGGADPEIVAAATFETATLEEDGLARAFEKLALI